MAEKVISKIQSPDSSVYAVREGTVIGKIVMGAYPIAKDSLFMFATDGKAYPFVQTATTSTATIIPNTVKFSLNTEILTNLTLAANSSTTNKEIRKTGLVDIRYSSVAHNLALVPNGTFNKLYMPININESEGTFTLKTETYTVSSTNYTNNFTSLGFISGTYYMFIGYNSTTNMSYDITLAEQHPIYYCDASLNLILYDSIDTDFDSLPYSPIAGSDIYASPEYPAIVCVSPYDCSIFPDVSVMSGEYLMFDILSTAASCMPNIDMEWGFALLTHDVSMGERVSGRYLKKQGEYILHPQDTGTIDPSEYNPTKQGAPNFTTVTYNTSQYRWYEYLFKTEYDNFITTHHQIPGGLPIYMGVYECLNEPISPTNCPVPGYLTPNKFRYGRTYGAVYDASGNLINPGIRLYNYAYVGKANTDASGNLYSVSLDFTDDEIYTIDDSCNVYMINGIGIGAGGINNNNPGYAADFMLDNPVSGAGVNPQAGESISPGTIVCMGTDGSIYKVDSALAESVVICQDWGLAVYTGTTALSQGDLIPQGRLMQQCSTYLGGSGGMDAVTPIYIVFQNQIGNTIMPAGVTSFSTLAATERTYVYAGFLEHNTMHIDFSNHDFIGLDDKSTIRYINGKEIGGSTPVISSYDNPVAGDAQAPIAAVNIPANTFVVLSSDSGNNSYGKLYPITSAAAITYDRNWGLAFLTSSVTAGARPAFADLKQQCFIPYTTSLAIETDFNSDGSLCYIHCANATSKNSYLTNNKYLTAADFDRKLDNLIYVGYRDASGNISVDLSNHDFHQFDASGLIIAENGYSLAGVNVVTPPVALATRSTALVSDFTIPGTSVSAAGKALSLTLPSGKWMVTSQLAIMNVSTGSSSYVTVTSCICSSTNTLNSTGISNTNRHTGARTSLISPSSNNAYDNAYLQCIINTSTNLYVGLYCYGSTASRGKLLYNISEVGDIGGSGIFSGTNMVAVRLSDYEEIIN